MDMFLVSRWLSTDIWAWDLTCIRRWLHKQCRVRVSCSKGTPYGSSQQFLVAPFVVGVMYYWFLSGLRLHLIGRRMASPSSNSKSIELSENVPKWHYWVHDSTKKHYTCHLSPELFIGSLFRDLGMSSFPQSIPIIFQYGWLMINEIWVAYSLGRFKTSSLATTWE